jgi:predicted transcriptional regulator
VSEVRRRIRRHVTAHPGVHFNSLVRQLDLAPGQVQHHLKRLTPEAVVAESLYGRTHYYPPAYDEWERGALALLRRETARDVLEALAAGPQAPDAVAGEVGVARSTLEWHLDHLLEQDLVEKAYGERGQVTVSLARPAETADLVATVEPSLPDRLVDRFTRLVDSFLDPE